MTLPTLFVPSAKNKLVIDFYYERNIRDQFPMRGGGGGGGGGGGCVRLYEATLEVVRKYHPSHALVYLL